MLRIFIVLRTLFMPYSILCKVPELSPYAGLSGMGVSGSVGGSLSDMLPLFNDAENNVITRHVTAGGGGGVGGSVSVTCIDCILPDDGSGLDIYPQVMGGRRTYLCACV
jgi:hypothetical protein